MVIKPRFTLPDTCLIGVGAMGTHVTDRILTSNTPIKNELIISDNLHDLTNSEAKLKLVYSRFDYYPDKSEDFDSFVSECNNFLILVGLGGSTEGILSVQLTEVLKSKFKKTPDAVVTLPFRFEGPLRMKRALKCVNSLFDRCSLVHIFPNQNLFSQFDRCTTVNDAHKLCEEYVAQRISSIY